MAYRIIFFGTSDFSIPSLEALLKDDRFDVVAVVTKADAPIGRHQEVTAPPVKSLALKNNIPVLQFEKIKADETFESLNEFQDIETYVVVSYGKIIPQRILDLPKHGIINVHGSLLPRWRGASCVQAAIAGGDQKTGVTIMKMDADLDHGDILAQTETEISPEEMGGLLHDRLALMGAEVLPQTLFDFIEGRITSIPQDHDKATFCRTLKREDGQIDWKKSATEIERTIRAYEPWPGTFTDFKGKRVKIHRTSKPSSVSLNVGTGQIVRVENSMMVKCGDGQVLELLDIQPEGKRTMSSKEFLAGLRD